MAHEEELEGTIELKCPFDGEPIKVTVKLVIRKAVPIEEQMSLETLVDHHGTVYDHHGAGWYIELTGG